MILRKCSLGLLFCFISLTGFSQGKVSAKLTAPSSAKPGSEITVSATIVKGNVTGFAKFQVDLPDGLSAKQGDVKGGSFTYSDQKLKIIWMSLPSDPQYTISFTLSASPSYNARLELAPILSYIENNEVTKLKVPGVSIDYSGGTAPVETKTEPPPAEETKTEPAPPPVPETKAEPVKEAEKKPEAVTETSLPPVVTKEPSPPPPAPPANVPSTSSTESKGKSENKSSVPAGIVFRVQLGSSTDKNEIESFRQKAGTSDVESEPSSQPGRVKFIAGNFKQYTQAKALRDKAVQNGCEGAFIVAYKNGKSMNLKEALNETGQKWVP